MRSQVITAVATLAAPSVGQGFWSRDTDFQALSSALSISAQVYYPGSEEFVNASTRWSNLDTPGVNIVVSPATENDVVEIVKFANTKGLPFLAWNSAHGAITTLGNMTNGIEIYLNQLSGVELSEDLSTVTVAGGTKSKLVRDTVWAAGKQVVTGACECVGYLGPGLGGGHGFLQGRHGLIGDSFESMNIVLANGTLTTIDSDSELWWAMNGAGHNFGVVTSVTSKIYDIVSPLWAFTSMTFKGELVAELYDTVNEYILKNGTTPVEVINWSYWQNSDLDPEPVVIIIVMQQGVTTVDSVYTDPFQALGPLATVTENGTYIDMAKWVGTTETDGPCMKNGAMNPRFPLYLETFNSTAQKVAFDLFAENIRGDSIFNGSLVTFDGYTMQGVRAVEDASTAFAYRSMNVLVGPLIAYMPDGEELDTQAAELGNSIRQALHEGTGFEHVGAYVNYAFGNEGPEQWYGYESWRQSKLQSLKSKYDPAGVFSFYGPIA